MPSLDYIEKLTGIKEDWIQKVRCKMKLNS